MEYRKICIVAPPWQSTRSLYCTNKLYTSQYGLIYNFRFVLVRVTSGCFKYSSIRSSETQSTILSSSVTQNLHKNLEIQFDISINEIRRCARKHKKRLCRHDNVNAIQLLDNTDAVRRLKRKKLIELV